MQPLTQVFSVLEAFSFLLDDGNGCMVSQQAMIAFHLLHLCVCAELTLMSDASVVLEKLHDEFVKFESRMAELYLLRQVASDLKSYRRMIKVKRYD